MLELIEAFSAATAATPHAQEDQQQPLPLGWECGVCHAAPARPTTSTRSPTSRHTTSLRGLQHGEEASAAALPPVGWEAAVSRSTGEAYYINTHTGESTYEVPSAPAAEEESVPPAAGASLL